MVARLVAAAARCAITHVVLIVLSPAKTLDYESRLPTRKHSQPRMLDRSEQLVEVLVKRSPSELAALMGISEELAELNAQRFADFTTPFDRRNARSAVLAFDGDVYRGMDVASFGERDFTEAQKTVRILSGLYGVLRPLDLMQPYRLEMGTKLRTHRGDTLYDYWGGAITDLVNADLAQSPGPDLVINLASNEYFRAVQPERLDGQLISPRFLDPDEQGRHRGYLPLYLMHFALRQIEATPELREASEICVGGNSWVREQMELAHFRQGWSYYLPTQTVRAGLLRQAGVNEIYVAAGCVHGGVRLPEPGTQQRDLHLVSFQPSGELRGRGCGR